MGLAGVVGRQRFPAGGRQLHRELAALTWRAAHGNAPTVRFDDALDETETETAPESPRSRRARGRTVRRSGCSAAAIPMPRSLTVMRTSRPVLCAFRPIQPPLAPYLIALPTRF
jgi:hypothetical protein